MSTVVIIDYGSGNLRSVAKAFEHATVTSNSANTILISAQPEEVRKAERIVLPGVGAFRNCLMGLMSVPGLIEALTDAVFTRGRPFLGICVGMQLMATIGNEHGRYSGLDWISGEVVPLNYNMQNLKVPHIGWNEFTITGVHPLFADLPDHPHAYFAHSYHFITDNPEHRLAIFDYGMVLTAVVGRNNLLGTQFHPEKSQAVGLILITNFLHWYP